jgi:CRISPR/Cas system-associated exonuclease Cas4 (RecB family)
VTDISRFHECPRRYYLSRYLRWDAQPPVRINPAPDDDSEEELPAGMTASELGRQVHVILAGQPVGKSSPEATQLADRFVMSQLGKRAARAQSKAHEWDFLFSAAGLVLRGQIDLWFEHNRELVVIDYKTDHEINPHSVAGHSLQVQLYALALERWMGRKPDRGVLYFVRQNTEVEVDLSPLALGAAANAVHEFREAQSRLDFPMKPGDQCWRCEFHRGLCPAGVTGGEATGAHT